MATTAPATRFDELCDAFPLRPIRSEKAHKRAMEVFVILAKEHTRDAIEYKHVLVNLIAEYEKEAGHRMDTSDVTPADVVRHLLDARDMTVNAFAKEIG